MTPSALVQLQGYLATYPPTTPVAYVLDELSPQQGDPVTIVSTPADRAHQQKTLFAQQRANQVRDLIVADELNWDGYNAAHTAYLKELETYRSNPCPATFDRLRSAVDGVQRSFGRLLETSQAANEIERILVAYYNPTGPAQEAQ